MKKQKQKIVLSVFFLTMNVIGVYKVSANMSLVQPRVNQIQTTDLWLPSGVSEPKWIFGTIIANLFDSSARIKAEFLTNIASGVSTNNIPLWNGSQFANSPLLYASPNLRTNGWFNFQWNRIYGDDSTALYYDSNNSSTTQMVFRDNESTRYGWVYGSSDGAYFWLLDGDTDWSYMAQKDTLTQLRVNNSVVAQFAPSLTNINTNTTISTAGQTELNISWASSGYHNGALVLTANSDTNYRALWTYMFDNGWDNEWFIWRPYAASDSFVINRRTWVTSHNADAASTAYSLFTIANSGNVWIWQTPTTDKLAVTGNIAATGDLKAARLCNAAGASCVSLPLAASSIDGGWSANLVARFSDADTLSTWVIRDNGTVASVWGAINTNSMLLVDSTWDTQLTVEWDGWWPRIRMRSMNAMTTKDLMIHYWSASTWENHFRLWRTAKNDWAWEANVMNIDMDAPGDSLNLNNAWNLWIGMWSWWYKLDVNGSARVNSSIYFINGTQRITWDGGSALYYAANNSTVTQQLFQDAEWTTYGRVYGDWDGVNFWLLSADGSWQVRTWNSWVELYDTSYANDFRSNIYYDRNDTNYYADPASTSYFNDFRPNIIYDRNDTSYYVDPNATSRFATTYSTIMYDTNDGNYYTDPNATSNVWRLDRQRGYGQVEYDINDTNYYVDPNWTSAYNDLRSNIMYDRQDTSYYVDPNSSTRLLNVYPKLIQPLGVGWDSGQWDPGYGIYQEAGAWVHPYPDLVIGWHTWIKIGWHYSYGWTRFYNDRPIGSAGGTEIFSVGNGDNYVRAAYGIIANGSWVKTSCVGNCF
jgi:hypothetical protein